MDKNNVNLGRDFLIAHSGEVSSRSPVAVLRGPLGGADYLTAQTAARPDMVLGAQYSEHTIS